MANKTQMNTSNRKALKLSHHHEHCTAGLKARLADLERQLDDRGHKLKLQKQEKLDKGKVGKLKVWLDKLENQYEKKIDAVQNRRRFFFS